MGRQLTPEEFQAKHARRLKASTEDIRAGIDAVTESPCAKAASKQDKMKSHLMDKIDDGTWAARLKAVSVEMWKTKARDVGVNRVSTGIDAAKDKVIDFAGQLLPYIYTQQKTIQAMPDLTLEDSKARATAWIDKMAKFKRR